MSLPPGWLPDDEAAELARITADKVVLELGAWKGRSTVVISDVAEYVVSVDRHNGIPGHGGDSLPEYLVAVRGRDNVAIVVADFDGFCPLLGYDFDVVFVDGDHDVSSVAADTLTALQHVVTHGTLVFHDWDFDSVQEGIRSVLGDRPPYSLVGSLAAFTVL